MMYDAMDFASDTGSLLEFRRSRLQTGGSCLVVVKLASLVVPLIGRPHEHHDLYVL